MARGVGLLLRGGMRGAAVAVVATAAPGKADEIAA